MFIPVFLVYILAGRDELYPEFILKSFFLLPIQDHLPLVGPTWMLSLFLVFYWLFSITFIFKSERVLYPIFIFWTLGCVYYSWLGWRPAIAPEWFQIIFDIRNVEFIFGYLAGKLVMAPKIKMNSRISIWSLTVGVMALIISIVWYNGITHELESNIRLFLYGLPLAMILFGLTCLEQLDKENIIIKVVTYKPLAMLGDTSYVIFLIHNVILRIWDEVIPITAIQEPLIIIVVLVAANIIYRLWEKPVLNYFRARTLEAKPLISQI
jgi:peptidoglycan/LPS O-acetylase OafA/YrhL